MIRLANAPVSYGVFGLARPDLVPLPSGERLLQLVGEAGYEGIDLGAHGLLGRGQQLVENLATHELALCGGWLDFPFTGTDDEFDEAFRAAGAVLDDFALVAKHQPRREPLPTIADSGDAFRRAHPGGVPGHELSDQQWHVFTSRIERVAEAVRSRGLEPTFHHHATTWIETPEEIDRLLQDTSMDLTLDSGHLILGGGNPLHALGRWGSRINHLHLKDVDRSILQQVPASDDMVREIWARRVFVPLGEGDLALEALIDAVVAQRFSGWLVVEQDVILQDSADVARAVADQRANREALRRWFP